MMLAVVRFPGSDRVQLVGRIAGARRPRHVAGEDPDEPVEVAADDRPVAAGDVLAALEREELESLTLLDPGELVRLEGIAEGAVAGAQEYVTRHPVTLLPYSHQVVYLDGIICLALLPLEAQDGAELDQVVVSYLAALAARRQQQSHAAAPSKERRRIHLT